MATRQALFVINDLAPRLSPRLATEIGLNESILLLQIDFWIKISGKEKDGRWWVYESITDVQEAFPFWSKSTVNRIVTSLKEQGLIHTCNTYNKYKYDRTRWFALDLQGCDKIKAIVVSEAAFQNETASTQNETASNQNGTGSTQNGTTIPDLSSDLSTEETTPSGDFPNPTTPEPEPFPTDSNFPPRGDPEEIPPITGPRDYLTDVMQHIKRGTGKDSPTIPADAGGADPWANGPVTAFCKLIHIPNAPPGSVRHWAQRMEKLAHGWQATPQEVAHAIAMIATDKDHKWRSFTDPHNPSFKGVLDVMISRLRDGNDGKTVRIRN